MEVLYFDVHLIENETYMTHIDTCDISDRPSYCHESHWTRLINESN